MYFLVAYKYNNYFTEKAYICKLYMYARARMDRIEAQKRILELSSLLPTPLPRRWAVTSMHLQVKTQSLLWEAIS